MKKDKNSLRYLRLNSIVPKISEETPCELRRPFKKKTARFRLPTQSSRLVVLRAPRVNTRSVSTCDRMPRGCRRCMAYSWLSRVVPSPRVPEEALGVVRRPEQVLHRLGLCVETICVVVGEHRKDAESVRPRPRLMRVGAGGLLLSWVTRHPLSVSR